MITILFYLFALAFSYLVFYCLYSAFLMFFGLGYKSKKNAGDQQVPEVLVLLPAYRPDPIFKNVVDQIDKLNISSDTKVNVMCLMQHGEAELTEYVKNQGYWVVEKTFDHLDGNSYHHALNFLTDQIQDRIDKKEIAPSYVVILDKDNLIDADFLMNIPRNYWGKYDFIQGRRTPISTEDGAEVFDAISECLNDTMFRSSMHRLSMMPEISGSAALIKPAVFCQAIRKLDAKAPGYDKNFMVQLLDLNASGAFVPESYVSEEKTADLDNLKSQRLRWFGEQYYNAIYNFKNLMNMTFKGNFSAFNYLLVLWRPPRSVLFSMVPLLGLVDAIAYLAFDSYQFDLPYLFLSATLMVLAIVVFMVYNGYSKSFISKLSMFFGFVKTISSSAAGSMKRKNMGKFIHTR